MLCNTVKGMNVNVWVVPSGCRLESHDRPWSTARATLAQAFKADDQAALIAKFTEIGEAIGALETFAMKALSSPTRSAGATAIEFA